MSDLLLPLLFCGLLLPACAGYQRRSAPTEDEFTRQRLRMVEQQLRDKGVRDKGVLAAMAKVPRHRFVPAEYLDSAYADQALPIGLGQTISQPFIVGYMTEAAQISAGEKALEIGAGSGYQAAVLGEIASAVYTIEIIPELARRAELTLKELGYKNISVKVGNGWLGWPEHAPFDAILVTAAPDEIPNALLAQLARTGRMALPVGTDYQEMVIITKTDKGAVERRTLPVRFVPMTGKPKN
jgi:protein-L-isoaspartate(D-aspartate) O-methyltransferase